MPDGSTAARQTVCWDAGPTVEPPLLGALKFVPLEKRCLGCFGPEKLDMFNNMFNNMSDILIIPIIIVRYYWSSQYVPNYWLVICQWLSHCSGEFDTGVPRGPSAGGMDQQLSVAGVVPWLPWNLFGLSFGNTQERQGAWSSIIFLETSCTELLVLTRFSLRFSQIQGDVLGVCPKNGTNTAKCTGW